MIKISLVIPTFDRAKLLDRALQSVANQTVKIYEVLVVDNASTDNTFAVVKKYKKYGVKYIRNKKNIGGIRNWKKAFSLARGEYISMLPSDDMIAPNWHEEWQKIIPKTKAKFYNSSVIIIDKDNKPLYETAIFTKSQWIKQPYVIETFWNKYCPGFATTAANMYHNSVLKDPKLYDPKEGAATDIRHGLVIASKYDIYYLHKYLFTHRVHDEQTFDKTRQKKSVTADLKITDRHFQIFKEFYNKLFKTSPDQRFFIQKPVFLYLAATNYNLFRGRWQRLRPTYDVAYKNFPDLLMTASDWYQFIAAHLHLLKRAVTFRTLPKSIAVKFRWLDTIKADL